MKRIILLASILMLSIAIHAQREVGTLTFQPKAGLNVAYYSGDESVDTKPRLGVVGGCGI